MMQSLRFNTPPESTISQIYISICGGVLGAGFNDEPGLHDLATFYPWIISLNRLAYAPNP